MPEKLKFSALFAAFALALAPVFASPPEEAASPAPVPGNDLALILKAEDIRASALLADSVDSENPAVRERAALALGRIGLPGDHLRLVEYLSTDAFPQVRRAAAFALGEALDRDTVAEFAGPPTPREALDALIAALDDHDPATAARAAEALGKIGDPAAVVPVALKLSKLKGELKAGDLLFAELASMALLRLEAKRAAATLARLADSPHASLRAMAARSVRRLENAEGREACLALLSDDDAAVRSEAARALGSLGQAEDAAPLAELMASDPAVGVRVEASRALRALGTPEVLRALRARFDAFAQECLAAPAGEWELENGPAANEFAVLLEALGETSEGDEALFETLDKLRAHDTPSGRGAMVAFAKVAARAGVPERLTQFPEGYRSSSIPASRALAVALGEAPCDASLEMVVKMLNAHGAPLLVAARLSLVQPDLAASLAKHGLGNKEEVMLRLLEGSEVYLRAEAASLIVPEEGTLSDEAAAALAEALAKDEDLIPDARLALVEALGTRTDLPEAAEALKNALKDPSRLVRMKAVKQLGLGSAKPEEVAALLGRRAPLRPSLAPRVAETEFYRAAATRGQRERVFAEIQIAGRGPLVAELWPEDAPLTVENFCRLAEMGLYDGLWFHRVAPNFVVQGGDPRGDSRGGPGHVIPCEINGRPFLRGTLGMALAGKDTGGSQFFICHGPQPRLDGGYTAFGRVVRRPAELGAELGLEALANGDFPDGFELLDSIVRDDAIIKVLIHRAPKE